MEYRRILSLFAFTILIGLPGRAEELPSKLRLPSLLSDHMVVQRDAAVRIWGWAPPGKTVSVALGMASAQATASDKGEWQVSLDKLPASSKPLALQVSDGTTTLNVNDILVGDVWLCSGQSNMAMALSACANISEELAKANRPEMRFFTVQGGTSGTPMQDCNGKWVLCTPDTAKAFSAVGYYFGREIQRSLQIPVGLIGSHQGASSAQVWVSREALAASPDLSKTYLQPVMGVLNNPEEAKAAHDKWLAEGGAQYELDKRKYYADRFQADQKKEPFNRPVPVPPPAEPNYFTNQTGFPTVLFNARIHPLLPFPIRGAIWYQGESNSSDQLYDKLLAALIADWRSRWGLGDFPFLIVQLPNKSKQAKDSVEQQGGWAQVRERQARVTQTLTNVGLATTIDLGSTNDANENNNLHPVEKENIGKRLALAAEHYAYGSAAEYAGPVFKEAVVQSNKIQVSFTHTADGLKIGVPPKSSLTPVPSSEVLSGFSIAGADQKFVPATAAISGKDTVQVWNESLSTPLYVRYGWQTSPVVNLYNSADLPATPFRSDRD